MKKCEYCGSLNEDGASTCSACGGNSFTRQCVNCGASFKDGVACPRCGVRVDQPAKKCPRCKATYYTASCPACGYTPEWKAPEAGRFDGAAQPAKKRRTVWWILGWIFIFPVPATILIYRSEKLPVWMKVLYIVLVWGLYVLIGRFA